MIKGFISYSHQDRAQCEALMQHLDMLRDNKIADFWADKIMRPGSSWQPQIDEALGTCKLAVFLVSPNLYHSDYVRTVELATSLKRHGSGECLVVPVLIKGMMFDFFKELNVFQPLPEWDRFIDELPNPNSGYLKVAKALRQIAEELLRAA